jgi:methylated-DNA-[protein]-cysteine S-methyltransferase
MSTTICRTIDTPVGVVTVAGDGSVITHVRMDDQRHPPDGLDAWLPDPTAFPEATRQLGAYFEGALTRFDLPLRPEGTPFQREVWEALRDIPYGATASYGEIARQVGRPGAARAVGWANGHNPISIIVPCHRVIGADGSLTGYGGGLERKERLLRLERDNATPRLALVE